MERTLLELIHALIVAFVISPETPTPPYASLDPDTPIRCQITRDRSSERETLVAALVAGSESVSGDYSFVREIGGDNTIRIAQGGAFELAPGERMVIGQQSIDAQGSQSVVEKLHVNGVPLNCGD